MMSERKTLNNDIDSSRQTVVMQNRRVDAVRKNFAVSMQRMAVSKSTAGNRAVKIR